MRRTDLQRAKRFTATSEEVLPSHLKALSAFKRFKIAVMLVLSDKSHHVVKNGKNTLSGAMFSRFMTLMQQTSAGCSDEVLSPQLSSDEMVLLLMALKQDLEKEFLNIPMSLTSSLFRHAVAACLPDKYFGVAQMAVGLSSNTKQQHRQHSNKKVVSLEDFEKKLTRLFVTIIHNARYEHDLLERITRSLNDIVSNMVTRIEALEQQPLARRLDERVFQVSGFPPRVSIGGKKAMLSERLCSSIGNQRVKSKIIPKIQKPALSSQKNVFRRGSLIKFTPMSFFGRRSASISRCQGLVEKLVKKSVRLIR